MPASYNTIVARAQLAQQFYDHATELAQFCTITVHDQHLQQQGQLKFSYINLQFFGSIQ